MCVSFLIVQHDIRGYLSIHALHNCSIIPLYWIIFCVAFAVLLSNVSTISAIKPLPSEDSGIAAPFSFVGAAQHLWELTRNGDDTFVTKLHLILSASILIAGVWLFIMCWYIIMVGLFGVFFIPFRLLCRSKHRQQQVALVIANYLMYCSTNSRLKTNTRAFSAVDHTFFATDKSLRCDHENNTQYH